MKNFDADKDIFCLLTIQIFLFNKAQYLKMKTFSS